ncbi:MAG: bifunctional folylpolyglutamate synthase/dihydrofolate synthase, partial [Prevotellaceae bacterium]|nr:bifunctional folylpolyglutamate synthase/dihydrofolate synthase [Prevotellaceae bacterium]
LYNAAPMFQNIGAGAYKAGLSTSHALDAHFGHPHRSFRSVHVAGTNGKGSTSHTLAALLQALGYRVGLYTSPHLVDFRERIRVNGNPIPKERVIDFVERERSFFEPLAPSFFELTTALAFLYFAEEKVDFAVIEVGLGGRLDCTNLISPELCVITNISLDHTQFLGDTLEKIATEKAGIIKPGVPVVVGQTTSETRRVFQAFADEAKAPLYWSEEESRVVTAQNVDGKLHYTTADWGKIEGQLAGNYQIHNTRTILSAIAHLPKDVFQKVTRKSVREAFGHVVELTGLCGRWQEVGQHPRMILDTGHNADAWNSLTPQLRSLESPLHLVIGVCSDKDLTEILYLLPKEGTYYFTNADIKRALP